MLITNSELLAMDRRYRGNLINALQGYKPANLIGSISAKGQSNVALFSSVVHIGANPPLIGFIQRPVTTERHTWENIQETGYYTINQVNKNIYRQAHQTSARYNRKDSEFTACGLTEEYLHQFKAPFVKESLLKIGVKFIEACPITINNTFLVVGSIEMVEIPDTWLLPDGDIDMDAADLVSVSGLYTYHKASKLEKLPYAKAK